MMKKLILAGLLAMSSTASAEQFQAIAGVGGGVTGASIITKVAGDIDCDGKEDQNLQDYAFISGGCVVAFIVASNPTWQVQPSGLNLQIPNGWEVLSIQGGIPPSLAPNKESAMELHLGKVSTH